MGGEFEVQSDVRPDPAQRDQLVEIRDTLLARSAEAGADGLAGHSVNT
ncbi:hypothetical protein [Streptomyces sp. NPDC059979]